MRYTLLASTLLLLPSVAAAQSQGAHVHGEAELAVVVEGETVSLSLMSAMYNITGFEHAPETDAEREVAKSAVAALENGGDLFVMSPSAHCNLVSSEHDIPELPSGHGDDTAEHDQHEGRDPDHEEAHNHGEEHEHEETEPHDHRDLAANFEFTCEQPGSLTSLEVKLFDHFENLEKVNAIVLTGSRQSATELTPDHRSLGLPGS